MRKHLAAAVAAAILSAGPLAAQDADELFGKLDLNKDGFVTPDEVQPSQQALYERLLRNADKDGDKKLSKEEFQSGLRPDDAPRQPLVGGQPPPGRRGEGPFDPREFFSRLDANKDGKLSKEEMPERMRENFARLDANSDGSVSQEEFGQAGRQFGRPPGAPQNPPPVAPQRGRPGTVMADREQFEALREQFEALFDRTDANSDGKLTKDEVPEERKGPRSILERAGESINKEQFVRGMLALAQQFGMPQTPPEGARPRPEGAAGRPEGPMMRRPDGPPGGPFGGGLFAVLDTDRDGQLSNAEIVWAGVALLKLDRNNDGKLTPDETFGPGGPPGRRGDGFPGDGRPGVGRPGDGLPGARPGENRPPEGRPGFGRGNMNPEAFRDRMKAADANKDGKISKEEAPPMLQQQFDRIDTNSDGFVDDDELRQMFQQRLREGGDRPGERGKARRPEEKSDSK